MRPFFGYVSAVEHNGKCKIRGKRSTFEGSKSLTAGDDFRQKSQISRARWSLPRGPEPHSTRPAQYFGDFEAGSSARAAGPFFGHIVFARRTVSKL